MRDVVQKRGRSLLPQVCFFSIVIVWLGTFRVSAQVENLSSGNSQISIDTSSQTGMNSWVIDGVNVLSQQWFWYRVGPTGPQASVDTLGTPVNVMPAANYLQSTYSGNANFSLQAVYSLVGGQGGSGASDLSEQIKIQNTSSGPLDFHFFQYADFATGPGGDLVQLSQNARGLYNEALVTSSSFTVSEDVDTAVSPGANRGDAMPYNNTLFNLNNVNGFSLTDSASAGPGGTNTWSFEWDKSIPVDGTLIISKDLNVVLTPEPGSWALASTGLAALGLARYRRGRPV